MSSSGSDAGGGGWRPPIYLYMATVQDAIRRGNKDEIRQLLDHARSTLKEQGDLGQAIRDLENALK